MTTTVYVVEYGQTYEPAEFQEAFFDEARAEARAEALNAARSEFDIAVGMSASVYPLEVA